MSLRYFINVNVAENYEMLKALYDFKATFAKTLSFCENDHFILHQSNTKQRNWWQVVNSAGQLGYIPSNYVTTVKVEPQYMIRFLDECIEKLRSEFSKPGAPLPIDKQDLVQRLIEKKRQADLSRRPKKPAPLPPTFTSSSPIKDLPKDISLSAAESDDKVSNVSQTKDENPYEVPIISPQIKPQRKNSITEQVRTFPRQTSSEIVQHVPDDNEAPKIPPKSASQSNVRTSRSSPKKNKQSPSEMDSHAAYKILNEVRKHTQLSYEMSKLAVTVVVSGLQQYLPSNISHYFDIVLNELEKPLMISKMSIEETYDAERLKVIFTELTSCKEDSQQRSWMLYEDEAIIVEYIKELTSILTNADANVSRHALRLDQYNGINTLIQYYQMEARWTIRQLLLQSFGVMCSLDPVIVTIMLNSILPMELARDMRSNPRNVPKLNYSSLLLTMIFSMGERMPITHVEQLGPEFIQFLLDLIEDPPDTDLEDQIPDLFLNLILSYNLQFSSSENILLNSLKTRTNAKTITQKILLLLNREGIEPYYQY